MATPSNDELSLTVTCNFVVKSYVYGNCLHSVLHGLQLVPQGFELWPLGGVLVPALLDDVSDELGRGADLTEPRSEGVALAPARHRLHDIWAKMESNCQS